MFKKWCVHSIQGCVQEFTCGLPGGKLRYLLISRRSLRKTGTRFYSRGVDDEGNVANFTETEQIAFVGDLVFMHLQIRGRYF